jgi:hypothetical protein
MAGYETENKKKEFLREEVGKYLVQQRSFLLERAFLF